MVITQEKHLEGFNTCIYSAVFPYKSDRIVVESTQGFENFNNAYIPYNKFVSKNKFLEQFHKVTYDTYKGQDDDILKAIDAVSINDNCIIKAYYMNTALYDQLEKPKEYLCFLKNIENDTYFIWHYDDFKKSNLESRPDEALNVPVYIKITDGWPALKGKCDFTFAVNRFYTNVYIYNDKHPFKDLEHLDNYFIKYTEAELFNSDTATQHITTAQNAFDVTPVYQGFSIYLRDTVINRLLDRNGQIWKPDDKE